MLNIPLMPRIKRAKETKKQNDLVDIKITKEKYVEGEEIKYTEKALEWQQKIEYMYRNYRSKIMDNKEIGLHNKMFNNKMFTINKEFHLKLTKIFNSNYKMLVDKLLSKEDSHKINHLYNNKIDKQTIE